MTATPKPAPGQILRITQEARVRFRSAELATVIAPVSYSDIGGLDEQVQAIRRMVEVPLLSPERFTAYGLTPPRGLLMHGPPGTGKTLIARAVASQTGAHVIIINASDILSNMVGETEAKLHALFVQAAEHAPSMIFIDELDALCAKRDSVHLVVDLD